MRALSFLNLLRATAPRGAREVIAFGLVCIAGLVLVARLGDYPNDAGSAVAALAVGSFRRAAAVPFLMGPLSIVIRAPFAWAADRVGASALGVYRAGIVPCLLATYALGIVLAQRARARSGLDSLPLVVVVLATLSPASVAAVQMGHPEEALGGALCVAAVMLAIGERPFWAGVTLGLAVATKQWALVAVVPVVLAAPARPRRRLLLIAAATAAVFYVPFVAGNPQAFLTATRIEAHVESAATPETIWLLASHPKEVHVAGSPVLTYHALPRWVPPMSHALIVVLGIPLGLILWRRRLNTADPLALLALVFLARCVLDPVDQDYFHLPFLLALLAWEVVDGRLVRGLPVRTLTVSACLWLTFDLLQPHRVNAWLIDAVYLAWTGAVAFYLLGVLGVLRRPQPGQVAVAA